MLFSGGSKNFGAWGRNFEGSLWEKVSTHRKYKFTYIARYEYYTSYYFKLLADTVNFKYYYEHEPELARKSTCVNEHKT